MIETEIAWIVVGGVSLVVSCIAIGFAIAFIRLVFLLHRPGGSDMTRFLGRRDQ